MDISFSRNSTEIVQYLYDLNYPGTVILALKGNLLESLPTRKKWLSYMSPHTGNSTVGLIFGNIPN